MTIVFFLSTRMYCFTQIKSSVNLLLLVLILVTIMVSDNVFEFLLLLPQNRMRLITVK